MQMVISMKIYLDLVFFLNFCYDFLILLTIDITLKRHTKIKRIIISSIIGALSLVLLFLPINNLLLFFVKIIVSIVMVLIAFRYKDIKYTLSNLFYMYMVSITLGGFLYFLNVQFSYKQEGLIFYFDGISTNYILLIIIAPIILYLYIKEHKKMKSTYNLNYEVKIVFKNNEELVCNGFIDSGNKLRDPITKKYIILVEKNHLKKIINNKNPIYVPFKALNKNGLVKCFSIKHLIINNQEYKNFLIGEADNTFHLEGIDCLLNSIFLEELCLEN